MGRALSKSRAPNRVPTGGARTSSDHATFVATRGFHLLSESTTRLVVVAAPAGYGKTSMLHALACARAADGRSVQWRALDDCAREPLGTAPSPDVVLIDDAHLCDPRQVVRFVRTLATTAVKARSPQYVIATRALPEIDWLSLQAKGQVTLLRLGDIVLDEEETARLLAAYAGMTPASDTLGAIHAWTEGWPIAVQLCGLVARRKGSVLRSTIDDAGASGDLFRFLGETLYAELDDAMRGFLTAVSDLDRFCPRMLGDLMGSTTASLLARALAENLMIVPARCGGDWFRTHGVFRAYLHGVKLRAGLPVDHGLLAQAADWCERERRAGDAIEYRLRIGDAATAERILVANAPALLQDDGEILRLLRWVEQIEQINGAVAMPLRLWRTWALVLTLQLAAAETELTSIVADMPPTAPPEWHAHRERLFISIAAQAGRTADVIARADAWLARWSAAEPFHAAAVSALKALALHQAGSDIASRREMGQARRYARGPGCHFARCWVAVIDVLLELETGRVPYAIELIERAIAEADTAYEVARPMLGLMRIVAARVHAENGHYAVAQQHLLAGQADGADHGIIETAIAMAETAAMLAEADGGVDCALVELRHAATPGDRFAQSIALQTVHLLLRSGRIDEAERVFLSEFATNVSGDPDAARAQAWLFFARGRFAEALSVAEPALQAAESASRNRACVSLFLLCAAAHEGLGERRQGIRSWLRAMRLAAEHGLRQTAIDHAWAVKPLLVMPDAGDGLGQDATSLMAAMRSRIGIAPVAAATVAADPDRLTPREAEVLRLLDTGMTSEMLADRMKLGQSTTKWHIKNIYAKLGVHNRSGAIARARQLALL